MVTLTEDEIASALTRFYFISDTLRNYLAVVEAAESIYNLFPPQLRESFQGCDDVSIEQEIMALSVAMAQMSPKARQAMRETYNLSLRMINERITMLKSGNHLVHDEDVELVIDLLKVVKTMQPKSKSWLRGWVRQAKEKMDAGFLILWGNGPKVEARHRYDPSEEFVKEAGIKQS